MLLILGAWGWLKRSAAPANIDCSLQGHPIPVGVLQSLSGPLVTASTSITEATELAIDEINQQGGVLGSRVEPIRVDGSSDESAFAGQAQRLILENHICALFGCCSSVGRKHLSAVVERYDNLLFYPLPCEGLEQSPNIVYLGTIPNQQVLPGVQFAIGTLHKRRLFLVGSDHVYSRTVHAILRDAFTEPRDVHIVGEELFPLSGGDVDAVAAKIAAGEADLIVNTIRGDTNGAFFRALHVAGVSPEKTPTLSFTLNADELCTLPIEPADRRLRCRELFSQHQPAGEHGFHPQVPSAFRRPSRGDGPNGVGLCRRPSVGPCGDGGGRYPASDGTPGDRGLALQLRRAVPCGSIPPHATPGRWRGSAESTKEGSCGSYGVPRNRSSPSRSRRLASVRSGGDSWMGFYRDLGGRWGR